MGPGASLQRFRVRARPGFQRDYRAPFCSRPPRAGCHVISDRAAGDGEHPSGGISLSLHPGRPALRPSHGGRRSPHPPAGVCSQKEPRQHREPLRRPRPGRSPAPRGPGGRRGGREPAAQNWEPGARPGTAPLIPLRARSRHHRGLQDRPLHRAQLRGSGGGGGVSKLPRCTRLTG